MKTKLINLFVHSSGMGLQFLSLTLMAWYFNKVDFATFSFILTITSLLAVFSRFGAQPTILKLGVNNYDASILNSILFVFPCVIFVSSIVGASIFIYSFDLEANYILPVFFISAAIALNGVSSVVFRLKGDFFRAILSTKPIEQFCLVLSLIICLALLSDLELTITLFSSLVFIISLSQLIFLYRRDNVSILNFNLKHVDKEIVTLAVSAMLVNFLQLAQKNIDVILLGHQNLDDEFAVYIFAQKFSEFFFFFIPLINIYFIHFFSKVIKNEKEFKESMKGVWSFYKVAVSIYIFLFVLFYLLSELLFELTFSEYIDSINLILILSFGKLFLIFSSPFTMLLLVNGKAKYVIISSILASLMVVCTYSVSSDVTTLAFSVAFSYLMFCGMNLFFAKYKLMSF